MSTKIHPIPFSQAVAEFTHDMEARRLSPHTLNDYHVAFKFFLNTIGDLNLCDITPRHIKEFLHAMANDITTPDGVAPRPARQRSKKTVANYHTALSALFTWAVQEGYAANLDNGKHAVRAVQPPKVNASPIVPYTNEEIIAMVNACNLTRPWRNKPLTQTERLTAQRDRAIILCLADMGLRNSELRGIRLSDLDWSNSRITIHGKGDKTRHVAFGSTTRRELRHWLRERPPEAAQRGDYLFCNLLRYRGHPLRRNTLSKLIVQIAQRAGVQNASTHRFRHTAAIRRLQNGMNVFQLKALLGHASLETTMRYVHVAELNMDEIMKRSSPVDNLRL